jgi:hypothetical protein
MNIDRDNDRRGGEEMSFKKFWITESLGMITFSSEEKQQKLKMPSETSKIASINTQKTLGPGTIRFLENRETIDGSESSID